MAAYAAPWTGRMRITYFAAQAVHSQTWRYAGPSSGSGVTDLQAAIISYYNALADLLYNDFVVNSVVVADVDSAVFLPIINPFTSLIGTVAMTDFEPEEKANAASFVGRSTNGGPWKISQYGLSFPAIQVAGQFNFRALGAENLDIGSTISALQTAGGAFLANDAGSVSVYNYANLKPNDRWVKKVRRGA